MELTQSDYKKLTVSRIIALIAWVGMPLVFLDIARIVKFPGEPSNPMLYILLVVALCEGLIVRIVQPIYIKRYRERLASKKSPAQYYVILSFFTATFVGSIFIFGFMAANLTGQVLNMLWFYILGAVFAVIDWPRRSHFERVIQELSQPSARE